MEWIYLSSHLDDVALSCGGLLWEQARQGLPVAVWTACAGDPPPGDLSPLAASLHARWGVDSQAVAVRRAEDAASCKELRAAYRHLSVPDCIYRRGRRGDGWLYELDEELNGSLHPEDSRLVEELSGVLAAALPRSATLVCPLAVGSHVDHQLTRAAVEQLASTPGSRVEWQLWYYVDYPYVARDDSQLAGMPAAGWTSTTFAVSREGLDAWGRAVAAYRSQISTFWANLEAMQTDLEGYSQRWGGVRLWKYSG